MSLDGQRRRASVTALSRRPFVRAPGLAVGTALAFLGIAGCSQPPPPTQVVLVTIGSLRYDALVGEGTTPSAMPRLIARARDGVLFSEFYSATPLSEPSLASLLTGRHRWNQGLVTEDRALPSTTATVAEEMSRRGISTWAVGAIAARPQSQGLAGRFGDYSAVGVESGRRPSVAAVTDAALARLASGSGLDRKMGRFLWIDYEGLEAPYGDLAGLKLCRPSEAVLAARRGQDPGPILSRCRSAYESDARVLDHELDRLLRRVLAKPGPYETHVVIVSTHGESFGEDGAVGHGTRLTREEIRVPLVILSPALEANTRRDVAGSIDVAHTVLALFHIKYPGSPWIEGRDLSAWAPDPAIDPLATAAVRAAALGMRPRTACPELRSGQSRIPLEQPAFYAVDRRGRLFAGDANGLSLEPPDMEPSAGDLARALFTGLARQFVGQARSRPAPGIRATSR